MIPTSLKGQDVALSSVESPEGETFSFAFADQELSVYQGSVTIHGELDVSFVFAGENAALELTYQACDDTRCLRPVTRELALK